MKMVHDKNFGFEIPRVIFLEFKILESILPSFPEKSLFVTNFWENVLSGPFSAK